MDVAAAAARYRHGRPAGGPATRRCTAAALSWRWVDTRHHPLRRSIAAPWWMRSGRMRGGDAGAGQAPPPLPCRGRCRKPTAGNNTVARYTNWAGNGSAAPPQALNKREGAGSRPTTTRQTGFTALQSTRATCGRGVPRNATLLVRAAFRCAAQRPSAAAVTDQDWIFHPTLWICMAGCDEYGSLLGPSMHTIERDPSRLANPPLNTCRKRVSPTRAPIT